MRQLKILGFSFIVFLLASSVAVAKDYCGFESSAQGAELKAYYYMSVAFNYCTGNEFTSRYQSYRHNNLKSHGTLHKNAENFFKEKLKSSSCRSDVGESSEKLALDKWVTSIGNAYSLQASNPQLKESFCAQADKFLSLKSSNEFRPVQIQELNAPVLGVAPSSTLSSSSRIGGTLIKPEQFYKKSHRALWTQPLVWVDRVGWVPESRAAEANQVLRQSVSVGAQ